MSYITERYLYDYMTTFKYRTLGQINVSDKDYVELINYLREKANGDSPIDTSKPDLVLSLALVQIAIRHYKDGRFWPCLFEQIGMEMPSSRTTKLGQVFYKTVSHYKLFCPEHNEGDFQYVEYIKAHAFVTNAYLSGFFDFSYAYFENNLFRQISSDIYEDLEDLSLFMQSTLSDKNDTIVSDDDSKKASKSYKLLKSTRTTFAQCDTETVKDVFLPVLQLIDKYFYDGEVPEVPSNRFELGFVEWCNSIKKKEEERKSDGETTRKMYSHKPFIKVNVDKEQAFVVIPPQKLRAHDCDGTAHVEITVNGFMEKRELDLYKSFGIYISEELRLQIPSIFEDIEIKICAVTEKSYHMLTSNYRIFNNNWESNQRFNRGHNYLLVKQGIKTKCENANDILDEYDGYVKWQYFSVVINDDSVFYVGNKPISLVGEFSFEPVFDELIRSFQVYHPDKGQIVATRRHPAVSFIVEKEKVEGTVLIINDNKYRISGIKGKVSYPWPNDSKKYAVTVLLESIIELSDGYFEIIIDIPGESKKELASYFLLSRFNCFFSKARYIYSSEADLTVVTDGYDISYEDEKWQCDYTDRELVKFKIPLEPGVEVATFNATSMGCKFDVEIPIRVFEYGFSSSSMMTEKANYIWYSDLKENLYIKMPGASSLCIYLDKDYAHKKEGVEIKPELFRIDISDFIYKIRSNERSRFHYINLEYFDNATRRLPLPRIRRTVFIDPYFKIYTKGGIPYTEVNIEGNADVYLSVCDKARNTVIDRKKIENGYNSLEELNTHDLYSLFPVMEESDEFGLSIIEYKLQSVLNTGVIDFSNLQNCRLPIKELHFEEEFHQLKYEYFIDIREIEDEDIYTGYLFGYKKMEGSRRHEYEHDEQGNRIKKKLGKVQVFSYPYDNELHLTLQCYSYQDEEWLAPYYDTVGCEIISSDSKMLDKHYAYDRFILLDEYITTYIVDTNRIKRIKRLGE